jgi:hypothetical protein
VNNISNARFEIQIEINDTRYFLDTYGYEPINFSYLISDINSIEQSRASFSKTIKLPVTPHNRIIFGDIGSLGVDLNFNPNKKIKCYVLADSFVVFAGNLQITNVIYNDNLKQHELETVIYSESNTLFKNIGEKYIRDLDLSEFNHTWTSGNVINSWTQSYTNGYFYPLIDYGRNWNLSNIQSNQNPVNTEFLYPATYVKVIWDRIFSGASYSYQSEFLNSDNFKNLLIPFGEDHLYQSINADDYQFRIGLSSSQYLTNTGATVSSGGLWVAFSSTVSFDDESSPNGDPNNLWSTTLYEYTHPTTSTPTVVQRFGVKFEVVNKTGATDLPYSNGGFLRIHRSRNIFISGAPTASGPVGIPIDGFNYSLGSLQLYNPGTNFPGTITSTASGSLISTEFYTSWLDGSSPALTPLYPGEKVWITYQRVLQTCPGNGFTFSEILPTSFIFDEVNTTMVTGGIIDYNKVLPQNIKQKDFVTSIIKMFNLYIEPSKQWKNTFIIEPRDTYYTNGAIEDWTDKLDLLTPIQETILSEQQSKTTLFKYKDDNDFFNVDYSARTNKSYGQYKYEIDNDFITDEKKIEIIFSPTPLVNVPNSFEFVIPKIVKDQQFNPSVVLTTFNIRILQKNTAGLIDCQGGDYWLFNSTGITYSQYPYVGHFDNPFFPADDINYGETIGLYYAETDVTNQNLFTKYWKNQMDEISDKDSRLVKCKMFINANDIANFTFNKNIYLIIDNVGQYYKVNKIENYDPGNKGLCDVELIKTLKITVPLSTSTVRYISPRQTGSIQVGNRNAIDSPSSVISGYQNFVSGDYVGVLGSENILTGKSLSVVGDANTTNGNQRSLIIGTGNCLGTSSTDNYVFGNGNTIDENIFNSMAVGNNMSVTQSGTLYADSLNISGTISLQNSTGWSGTFSSGDTIKQTVTVLNGIIIAVK